MHGAGDGGDDGGGQASHCIEWFQAGAGEYVHCTLAGRINWRYAVC